MPVRKQDALKHSAKWLARTKRMMQTYALARPTVRFQLRVLKAKNEKGNFTYAPKTSANVEDAAFKVIGRDCASQCDWTVLETDGYEIYAFLPKPEATASKISNEGSFISIDSRPVSSTRGTPRQIVAKFKERLREANPALTSVKEPFICMNIVCPPESYDLNIEPAKDDVLFVNEAEVLAAVNKLLNTFYLGAAEFEQEPPISGQTITENAATLPSLGTRPSIGVNNDTDHGPSVQPGPSIIIYDEEDAEHQDFPPDKHMNSSAQPRCREWGSTMYDIDENDVELLPEDLSPIVEEEEGRRDIEVSNPWTIAKMNAPIKPKKSTGVSQLMTPAKSQRDISMHSSSPMPLRTTRRETSMEPLTPQTLSKTNMSTPLPDAELERSIQRLPGRGQQYSSQGLSLDEEVVLIRARQSSLPPFAISRSRPARPLIRPISASTMRDTGDTASKYSFTNTGPLAGTPLHRIPSITSTPHRGQRNRERLGYVPLLSPLKQTTEDCDQDNWFNSMPRPHRKKPVQRKKTVSSSFHPPSFLPGQGSKGPQGVVLDAAERLADRLTSENNTDIRDFFGQQKAGQQGRSVLEERVPRSGGISHGPTLDPSSTSSSLNFDLNNAQIRQRRLRADIGESPGPSDLAAYFLSNPGPNAPRPTKKRNPSPGLSSSFMPVNSRSQHIRDRLRIHKDHGGTPNLNEMAEELRTRERETASPAPTPLSKPKAMTATALRKRKRSTVGRNQDPQEPQPQRRKSTHRPRHLSHVPPTYRTNNIALTLTPLIGTLSTIQQCMHNLDMGPTVNSMEWGDPAPASTTEWVGVFAEPVVEEKVKRWCEVMNVMMDEWFERREGVNVFGELIEGVMKGLAGMGMDQAGEEEEEMII
ncbi:hypothetical protein P154DRAFT_524672 [Amniculicola lignicola CBS 123094]|uniref:DNA mismatch repair protein S5 domain-containing protein n=1 Tax=Amniculicola lignicola CBS 123094 TaxID=1392246 RepID=A0A6A5W911_9PLEO|nr:hypothetical protein P154DRAFT_524672 [Amniculicola lignicola CBS 123094]